MEYITLIFLLFAGHALADYPLQGDFIGKFKSRHSPNPFPDECHPWVALLCAHCLIHAGVVYALTQNLWLALIELVLHFIIDLAKNEKLINFNVDQSLHFFCKFSYVSALAYIGYFN